MIFYLIVILGVLASSASQLLLKKSASVEHRSPIYTLLNWRVILAYYALLGLSLIANIFAMSKGVQLKDMPILEATGYIFVPLLTWLILHERIDRRTLASIGLILAGIVVFYL